MELIDSIILPGSLWLIMFSMGLHLTLDDFRRVMTNRRALTLGMVSMLIVPPLIGIPIAIFFAPTPALLVGFILLATCPGGMLSNLMTDFAKGDLALSLSLSILVSMIYVFVVPFYAHFALVQFMDVDAQVELPMLNFFWKIFSITLIPASLGLLSNTLWPKLAAKIKTPVKLGGTLALVVAFGYILVDQIPVLVQYADSLFGISLAMNVLTLASAIALSKAMGLIRPERIAIGIEHLIRQEGTAIYIAVTIVGSREMSLPMIMNTPVALVICILFVIFTRQTIKKYATTG